MEYDALVEMILADETLKAAANRIADDDESLLNLLTPDWKDVLENDVRYQNFAGRKVPLSRELSKKHYVLQYVGSRDVMRVVVAGYFTISDSNQLACVSCPPLLKLGRAVFSDRPEVKVLENYRFFVRSCDGYSCRSCSLVQTEFNYAQAANRTEWCIDRTRVYNGINVVNMFRTTVLDSFRQIVFPAIVSVVVDCRFVVAEERTGKIGGKCVDMLLFRDSSLGPRRPLNLQDVVPPAPVVSEEQREEEAARAAVEEEVARAAVEEDIRPTQESAEFLKRIGYGAVEERMEECRPRFAGRKPDGEPPRVEAVESVPRSAKRMPDEEPPRVGVESVECVPRSAKRMPDGEPPRVGVEAVECIPRSAKRMPDEEPLVDVEVKRVTMSY